MVSAVAFCSIVFRRQLCNNNIVFATTTTRIGIRRQRRVENFNVFKRSAALLHTKNQQQHQRRTIVTQLSPTTSLLRADESENEVYLIGTAHISEASANEATDLISVVRPQTVFIELDAMRAAKLRSSSAAGKKNDGVPPVDWFEKTFQDAFISFMKRGGLPNIPIFESGDMLKTAISGMYGALKRYGYVPGVEMLAAMEEADRVNATVFYGDRHVDDTMRDLRASLSLSLVMKAMQTPTPPELDHIFNAAMQGGGGGVESLGKQVEALKTRDHARLMSQWMEKALPEVADVMIHRRDQIMAQNLRKHCGKGKVVAVVGLAHVDGIERHWQELGPKLLK